MTAFTSSPIAAQPRDPLNPTCPLNPNWSSDAQMRFDVQQIDGRPVLLAEGRITEEMLPRLRDALAGFRGGEVRLRSSGGDPVAAEEAGRMLREQGLVTRIPADWACFGACAFMFLGGQLRHLDAGGLIIFQMFTFTDDPRLRQRLAAGPDAREQVADEIAVYSARQATLDNDYVMRMGVTRRLLTEIVYRTAAVPTPHHPATRRCLTQSEAQTYNVVNDRAPGSGSVPVSNLHK